MNRKDALVLQIKRKAMQDKRNRRDRRFLDTLGFLVAKGLLKTNLDVPLQPNRRLHIDDAVWAGRNIEPRILEVLPAAVLRLPRHFDFDAAKHKELAAVLEQLRKGMETGDEFLGMPYAKVRAWINFPLRDRRVKPLAEKKVVRTYRLHPAVVARLKAIAKELACTETEALEKTISKES